MRLLQSSLFLCFIIAACMCASPTSVSVPGEGVAGRITNEKGNAIEGAAVHAASLDPNGPAIPEIAIVSDANGRYEWALRAGRYELTVVADGYERASKSVVVSSGKVATLDFVLSRERRGHYLEEVGCRAHLRIAPELWMSDQPHVVSGDVI